MIIRNLIFDLDGTLVDSSDGVVEAVNYSLRCAGAPERPPDVIKAYIGYPLEEMYRDFTDLPVGELREHFRIKAARTVVPSATALQGADSVLRTLHAAGYRMAVATTKIRQHVDGILAKLGWDALVSVSVSGNEVKRVKPDPEPFRLALQGLAGTPEDTLAVGDTINDVLAARAVPMQVVAVSSPYGGREKLKASKPDFFIESIAELPALLNGGRS
ncbi:MAG TPA: HAD family hydrolase [Acidobacteriota bacterium]|nr:HAD family hydrolase [Acidobacteriota bacterium]